MWLEAVTIIERFRADCRGVAATEYIILVGTVGLGSAAAFIAVGAAFVRNFALVRNLLLTPFP
jgi:Flp pilus assembly pilin Flp